AGNHAMRMLEKRSAGQLPQGRKPRSKRFRPVRNGQRRVIGSDQRYRYEQKHRPRHHKFGEPVHPRTIRGPLWRKLIADYSAASILVPSRSSGAADRLLRLPLCALCASAVKILHPTLAPDEVASCPAGTAVGASCIPTARSTKSFRAAIKSG